MATHQNTSKGESKKKRTPAHGKSPSRETVRVHPKLSDDSDIEPTEDQASILTESSHIPDRDQLFGADHQSFPPNIDSLYDDSWDDNPNKRMNDDRGTGKDLYNALRDLDTAHISRPTGPSAQASETLKVANRAIESDHLDLKSDHELESLADAMGIPGRESLNRDQIIETLRSIGGVH